VVDRGTPGDLGGGKATVDAELAVNPLQMLVDGAARRGAPRDLQRSPLPGG
jgi:hypothetical protein